MVRILPTVPDFHLPESKAEEVLPIVEVALPPPEEVLPNLEVALPPPEEVLPAFEEVRFIPEAALFADPRAATNVAGFVAGFVAAASCPSIAS